MCSKPAPVERKLLPSALAVLNAAAAAASETVHHFKFGAKLGCDVQFAHRL